MPVLHAQQFIIVQLPHHILYNLASLGSRNIKVLVGQSSPNAKGVSLYHILAVGISRLVNSVATGTL